jgi:hypothetical protein
MFPKVGKKSEEFFAGLVRRFPESHLRFLSRLA